MIEIKVSKNRLIMNGHARHGEKGQDIVCAAATILWYTITEKLLKEEIAIGLYEKAGYAELVITETRKEKRKIAELLLETMIDGFEAIEKEYPQNLLLKRN